MATGGLSSGPRAPRRSVDEMLEENGCQATEKGYPEKSYWPKPAASNATEWATRQLSAKRPETKVGQPRLSQEPEGASSEKREAKETRDHLAQPLRRGLRDPHEAESDRFERRS